MGRAIVIGGCLLLFAWALYCVLYFGWLTATPLTAEQHDRVRFDYYLWLGVLGASLLVACGAFAYGIYKNRPRGSGPL